MELIIALVVILIVVIIVKAIIGELELSEPIRRVVYLVFALIVLLWLLNHFGIMGAPLFR